MHFTVVIHWSVSLLTTLRLLVFFTTSRSQLLSSLVVSRPIACMCRCLFTWHRIWLILLLASLSCALPCLLPAVSESTPWWHSVRSGMHTGMHTAVILWTFAGDNFKALAPHYCVVQCSASYPIHFYPIESIWKSRVSVGINNVSGVFSFSFRYTESYHLSLLSVHWSLLIGYS